MVSSLYVLYFVKRHSGKLAFLYNISIRESKKTASPHAFERKCCNWTSSLSITLGVIKGGRPLEWEKEWGMTRSCLWKKLFLSASSKSWRECVGSGEQFSKLCSELRDISECHWRAFSFSKRKNLLDLYLFLELCIFHSQIYKTNKQNKITKRKKKVYL